MTKALPILFFFLFASILCFAGPFQKKTPQNTLSALCVEAQVLNNKIRDGLLTKTEALKELQELLPAIKAAYSSSNASATPHTAHVFPLAGYDYKAIGGKAGSGYLYTGYDYFAGNKHGGHPAHDIFIRDKDQDGIDDVTHQPVPVVAYCAGIVLAVETNWDPKSDQRGGNYIWIYNPDDNTLVYYAHNSQVLVQPGTIVFAGDKIAFVGRSGANAAKKRSPTHLHFMKLALDKNWYPRPVNDYDGLMAISKR